MVKIILQKAKIAWLHLPKKIVIFWGLFFGAFLFMQLINNRFWMHDFQVYYDASNNFLSGKEVYLTAYGLGSGIYKYSPFALILFAPFSMLSFFVARLVYFILLCFCIMCVVWISHLIINKIVFNKEFSEIKAITFFLVIISFLQHIYTELHLGNINIILLFLCLIALVCLYYKKDIHAGILFALVIMIKPHFIILLPLYVLRKKWKLLASIFISVVLLLVIPAVFIGWKKNILLLNQWKESMLVHNISIISGQDTLYSWIYRLFHYFGFIINEKYLIIIVLTTIAALIALLVIRNLFVIEKNRRVIGMNRNFLFENLLLVALIPNLTVTDSEHFLLSVPLITWGMLFFRNQRYKLWQLAGFIICLIMYGGNLRDIIGKSASRWLTDTGILGLGNFLLLILIVSLFIQSTKKKQVIQYEA